MNVKPLAPPFARAAYALGGAATALWTFPSMLLSAFLVAWGAEAAQFVISQGLALAVLAWLQTLPEAAVEGVIAWQAGKDPARAHLAIANLTGAIRLLIGLGWPMIYVVASVSRRRRGDGALGAIRLEREHAVEVVGLVPPLLWFVVIWWKQTITVADSAVLLMLYSAYLWVLWQHPPHEAEEITAAPVVARWAWNLGGTRRVLAIAALFVAGGALLYVTTEPFLESMLAVATMMGASQFVFVQWVAPFLSEFPEKVSAFMWAKRVSHAPMALMNMVSSNINQWTVLAAMIPIVYGWSHATAHGSFAPFAFDGDQVHEIALTIAQSALATVLLMDLKFRWHEAALLFVLWLVQFLVPSVRVDITMVYCAWAAVLLALMAAGRRGCPAPRVFLEIFRENRARNHRA
ncbi:MAG: sodium:calcium antiporter [Gemmatimonadales bacterium]